jgi:hypothetical protein
VWLLTIYVSTNWELEKRVIGFKLIDCSHSGINIAEHVETVISQFGFKDKGFSITLDNAYSNASTMSKLISKFIGYLSLDPEPHDKESATL